MAVSSKIFLIGFMGSGKSTLGKRLANKLNVQFFDLDEEIEKKEGRIIHEIFEKEGEDYFRKLESEMLHQLIANNDHFVMALGGGTPCFYNNMDVVNQAGITIYLKYNSGILTSRLINSKTQRPLIQGKPEDELTIYIETKLNEREPYYSRSKFIVEEDNLKVDGLIDLIQ